MKSKGSSGKPMNWWIFVILLIVFWPAALIYMATRD